MPIYDDDEFDPISMADTGTPKEWTDDEVRTMLDEDEKHIQELKQAQKISALMNKVLSEIECEHAEESGATTSILREKILRGVRLSDSELENTVFAETCRLIFGKITVKEFLRRMSIVSGLTDLDIE
jgi:hypothetical protein